MDTRRTLRTGIVLVVALLLTACSDMNVRVPLPSDNTLYQDEFTFGRTGSWDLEGDDTAQAMIVPEQLMVQVNAPDTVQYATLLEPTFSDFALEVDVRQLNGDPQSSYGVMFRMQGPDQFYRFEITSNGMYMLERRNPDGTWFRFLPDWKDSPAIVQGLNAPNRLKVVARGPRIAVYVNDTLLEEVTDRSYTTGQIALDAGTFGRSGLQVSFDNLLVYPPDG